MRNQYEQEIVETEKAFARHAKEKGLKEAFLIFASDDAVLSRGEQLIKGREAIADHFDRSTMTDVNLEWEPDFVDAAESGDLGYTYGKFKFEGTDQDGKVIRSKGVFHTVWKKNADGEWRYVWD
ncbi:YybH family protein [Chloroflexota bacterium]